jgi:hypothetical protein
MLRAKTIGVIFVVALLVASAPAVAQDLMLTEACEEGFHRLMRMAQEGRLGADVTNANIGVEKIRVRVELVRGTAPGKLIWLKPRSSAAARARFFDVSAGAGATEDDLERVARALDEIFVQDPFVVAGFEAVPAGDPIPELAAAWTHGGWRGVLRALERRTMALASIEYTIGVILVLAVGLAACLVLLWGSSPPR